MLKGCNVIVYTYRYLLFSYRVMRGTLEWEWEWLKNTGVVCLWSDERVLCRSCLVVFSILNDKLIVLV